MLSDFVNKNASVKAALLATTILTSGCGSMAMKSGGHDSAAPAAPSYEENRTHVVSDEKYKNILASVKRNKRFDVATEETNPRLMSIVADAVKASNEFTGREDEKPLVVIENNAGKVASYAPEIDAIIIQSGVLSLSDKGLESTIAHELGHRDDRDRGVHFGGNLHDTSGSLESCTEIDKVNLKPLIDMADNHPDTFGENSEDLSSRLEAFGFKDDCVDDVVGHFEDVAAVKRGEEAYSDKFMVAIGKADGFSEVLTGQKEDGTLTPHMSDKKRVSFVQKLMDERAAKNPSQSIEK